MLFPLFDCSAFRLRYVRAFPFLPATLHLLLPVLYPFGFLYPLPAPCLVYAEFLVLPTPHHCLCDVTRLLPVVPVYGAFYMDCLMFLLRDLLRVGVYLLPVDAHAVNGRLLTLNYVYFSPPLPIRAVVPCLVAC